MENICFLGNLFKTVFKPLIPIIFVLVVSACSTKTKYPENEISDEIVLKIGPLEITRYEFEKDYNRESGENASIKVKEEWLKGYINKMYFLADAYAKQYDTIGQINRMVQYAARTRMAKIDEYLWNFAVKPKLTCSKEEMKEVREKRAFIQNFEVIAFPTQHELTEKIADANIQKSVKEFYDLYNSKAGYTICFNTQWPFHQNLLEVCDFIYEMKPGDVSKPIQSINGVFIIHMIGKSLVDVDSVGDKEIEQMIIDVKTCRFASQKNQEIREKAQTIINYNIVNTIFNEMEKDFQNWFKAPLIDSIKNEIAFEYRFNGELRKYTLTQFLDYYQNNPLLMIQRTRGYIEEIFNNIILEEYLFDEAEKLGVTKNKKYILDRRNLLNRTIEDRYEQSELNSDTLVPVSEMEEYYQKNLDRFKDGRTANVTFLFFNDRKVAIDNMFIISSMVEGSKISNLCDTLNIREKFTCRQKIVDRTNTDLPTDIINIIFRLKNYMIYPDPVYYNNNYVLIYKTLESGEYRRTFNETRKEIQSSICFERFEDHKKQRLKELKKKYQIEINKIKL